MAVSNGLRTQDTCGVVVCSEGGVDEGDVAVRQHDGPLPKEAEAREERVLYRQIGVLDHHGCSRQLHCLDVLDTCTAALMQGMANKI